jgi:hypothetical protein
MVICRESGKKGKKGKKKRVIPRQRRPRKIKDRNRGKEDYDIEFQNIFSDKFGQRGMDMSMSVS